MHIRQRHRFLLPVLLLIFPPAMASAWGGELWEIRGTMESAAYGSMPMGANRECRAANWRENPEFRAPGNGSDCTSRQVKRQGDGYSWKFDCGATSGEGNAHMAGRDRMEGQMRMNTPQGHFVLRFTSRRLGQCEPGSRG